MRNITAIDLNLLNIFVVLMEEQNVSRAAKRVHLSQPSVSHALGRLRDYFDDPLLVRGSKGMVATPKAFKLIDPIRLHLQGLNKVLTNQRPFVAATATGTIRVSGTDYFEHLLLPKLIPSLKAAPYVNVYTENAPDNLPKPQLEDGRLDIAIAAFFGRLPEGFYKQKLYDESFVGAARKGHPILNKKASLQAFVSYPHIVVSLKGAHKHVVDLELKENGLERRIAFSVSNLLSSGPLLSSSDCIIAIPRRVAKHFAKNFQIETFELPIKIPQFDIVQIWHNRMQSDPLHSWFRRQIKEACKDY